MGREVNLSDCEKCGKAVRALLPDPTTMVDRYVDGAKGRRVRCGSSPRRICLKCIDAMRAAVGAPPRSASAESKARRVAVAVHARRDGRAA